MFDSGNGFQKKSVALRYSATMVQWSARSYRPLFVIAFRPDRKNCHQRSETSTTHTTHMAHTHHTHLYTRKVAPLHKAIYAFSPNPKKHFHTQKISPLARKTIFLCPTQHTSTHGTLPRSQEKTEDSQPNATHFYTRKVAPLTRKPHVSCHIATQFYRR